MSVSSLFNLTLKPFTETFLAFSRFQHQDFFMALLADFLEFQCFCIDVFLAYEMYGFGESEKVVVTPKIFPSLSSRR